MCILDYDIFNKDVETYIESIAQKLFKKHVLIINNNEYIFTELEFYFYSNYHQDEYCHLKDLKVQNYKSGDFRFHYSGIDLVLLKQNEFVCGVLIRGVKRLGKNSEYINGPLRVLNEFCNNLNNLFDNGDNIFKIKQYDNFLNLEISNISRFGLGDKYLSFKSKKYRYLLIDIIKENQKTYYNSHVKRFIEDVKV